MKRALTICFLLLGCVLALATHTHAAPQPQASVDRKSIAKGDSFILTIRAEGTGDYAAPDYRALEQDFQVFGNSESSQRMFSNGRIESWTEWQTTLVPKHSGRLVIPAIEAAGGLTQPIVVQVEPASGNVVADGTEPIFIEVQTDRKEVYVQQQLLLTARVYVAVALADMQLTKPEFADASAKQTSETTFEREINGTRYEVHELTYAIFPQQAGTLTIPELVFSAVQVGRPRSLFDFPGQGRALRKLSEQLSVKVKPVPPSFSGPVWLPARNLTVSSSWSGDPHHLAAGESITRSIDIRADGLLASQLPTLDAPQLDNAKFYADQPQLDDQQDNTGAHGKRVENAALIPTRAGSLEIPPQKIVWWDIDTDSEKVATLPAETLTIKPGAQGAVDTAIAPSVAQPAPSAQTPSPAPVPAATAQSNNAFTAPWWPLAALLLAIAWLITLLLFWRQRRRIAAVNKTQGMPEEPFELKDAWSDFVAACRMNDAPDARRALLRWARLFYPERNLRGVEQLQRFTDDPQLGRELQLLDNRLYGTLPDSGEWNGETLLQVVTALKKSRGKNDATNERLATLYPAS